MMITQSRVPRLFTIGHSDHETEHFLSLLVRHGITAVADVRSQPYSRFAPQYNRENLLETLKNVTIGYLVIVAGSCVLLSLAGLMLVGTCLPTIGPQEPPQGTTAPYQEP